MKARLTAEDHQTLQVLLTLARDLTRQLDALEVRIAALFELEGDEEGIICDAICGGWTANRLLSALQIEAPTEG